MSNRQYIDLLCGCKVFCDDGGGLIPCEEKNACYLEQFLKEHKFCDFCGKCLICFEHYEECYGDI